LNSIYQNWAEMSPLPQGREDKNPWSWSVTPIDRSTKAHRLQNQNSL
jgi:hypothetical protein